MSKIEKPWCVICICGKGRGWNVPKHIGRVEKEERSGSWQGVWARYYERQRKPDFWGTKCVSRFKTIGGAIRKYARLSHKSPQKIRNLMLNNFPSEKKSIQRIKV
ncbi:MAG: hypothetical protein WC697_01490 [Patescibacteria group bacterium]